MSERDRAKGVLLGLACGDALGRPVEGWSVDRIDRTHGTLREFVGGGVHDKPPGTVTDDTELTLVLARSLVDCDGYDRENFVERLVAWYESRPFGIGGTTTEALRRIAAERPPEQAAAEARDAKPAGEKATNGSVMRCAPIAIAYEDDRTELQRVSRDSSVVTHADARCTYGCAVLNLTIASALAGETEPLAAGLADLDEDAPTELVTKLAPVPDEIDPDTLEAGNDAVATLQTALYHALTAGDPETAIVRAVNEGGDTDTVGAVTGAVAGGRFGASALPERWCSELEQRAEIESLAVQLAELA